jgi:hypothetical protein
MAGRIERAVRASVAPGAPLTTPTGRGHFTVARYTSDGLTFLLGAKEAWTPLPWRAMEGIPDFYAAGGWVLVGDDSVYSTRGQPGTLDEYLKTYLKRATAGWVAVVLEHAGVVAIDRSRPARVKLNSRW